jgi:electron transport complex protein RnfE
MPLESDRKSAAAELSKGLWRDNPVFIAALGLCPALAVTNSLMNALVMGAATTFVLVGSSTLISLLRRAIPRPVRISIYIIVIATFVTTVDFVLAALLPDAHRQLGAFISLIVVNCLILGRQEAFSSKQPVHLAVADALGMSAGFTLALSMIGAIREVLGSGTLLGFGLFGESFEPWAIMILPPGGFLSLGLLLVVFSSVQSALERRRRAAAAAPGRAV